MSDQSTVYGYLTAFHAHHAAVEKVEELATWLAVLAKGLLDWKTTATAAASRLPSLAEWPSAEQLVKHLEACAATQAALHLAWQRVPQNLRAGLVPPPAA